MWPHPTGRDGSTTTHLATRIAHLRRARRLLYAAAMNHTIAALLTAVALATTVAACKKDDKQGEGAAKTSDKADKAAGKDKKAEPAAPKLAFTKLGGLGVEAELPEGTQVDDNTAGAGFPSATIWASPTTFVHGAGDLSPIKADLAAAKAEIEKDPNPFQKYTKEQTTEGGWHLEYELQSMMDKETLYGVTVRTTIDGKPYDCSSNTRSAAERDAVAKICGSLRKAN